MDELTRRTSKRLIPDVFFFLPISFHFISFRFISFPFLKGLEPRFTKNEDAISSQGRIIIPELFQIPGMVSASVYGKVEAHEEEEQPGVEVGQWGAAAAEHKGEVDENFGKVMRTGGKFEPVSRWDCVDLFMP